MCLNKKVLTGLGVVALVAVAVAGWRGLDVLPALVVLACPLSMIAMMGAMSGGHRRDASHSTRLDGAADDEVASLRAEVAELRRHQAAAETREPSLRPR